MQKLFIFIALTFGSCSQAFLEETQETVYIDVSTSYNTMNEGILLSWKNQRDFVRVEMLKGETPDNLSILLDRVTQEELLDDDSTPGIVYHYLIKAYNSRDRQIGQSDIVRGYRSYRSIDDVAVPTDLLASKNKYSDQIKILWLGDHVNHFRVYRANVNNTRSTSFSDFKVIAEVGFNSKDRMMYLDKDVLGGREYQYKISSVGQDENGTIIEKYTENVIGSTLNAPNGVVASRNYEIVLGGIHLTWTEDSTVSYYKIYRSNSEDGEYLEIDPYIDQNSYVDTSMPNLEGQDKDGVFTYPSYYYKIKSVKEGEASVFSAMAVGSAINPNDYLPAPDVTFSVDNTVFPYTTINLTWGTDPSMPYQVSEIDLSTDTTNILNQQITTPMTSLVYKPNHTYLIRYINASAGNTLGLSAHYKPIIPSPPTLNLVSDKARDYTTNETIGLTITNTHIYYGRNTKMTGMITQEWIVSSTGDFINLEWTPSVENENIDHYTIYRKKQGDINFVKIHETAETLLRDDDFTQSQLQGTGFGATFAYPIYEYQITATYRGEESFPSALKGGSAVRTADIPTDVVSYLSVPFHWAYNTWGLRSAFKKGDLSPIGFDNIMPSSSKGNFLYLAWGNIEGVTNYRVKHLADHKTVWYDHGNISDDHKYFDNSTIGNSPTGLFAFLDGVFSYEKNQVQFSVATVSENVIVGYEKIILFEEPNNKPY